MKMKKVNVGLFFLFSISGFAGLIYESVWSNYIKLILGHAAYAQTLVLTIFMGGMALGAWIIGRYSTQITNPLKWYAIIEGIIGVFGIAFHQEFLVLQDILFIQVLPVVDWPFLASMFKWSTAAVMLLPQAILLGTTFPLMSAAIIRNDNRQSGHTLGMLYFTNSIGAAIGVLVSGFILIEKFGLPGTTLIAGYINVLLGICVWILSKSYECTAVAIPSYNREISSNPPTNLFIVVAMLTGAASFFYEIGWIRMLSLVLGSSVQAFELMLSAFIAGLAFGSYYIRQRADRIKNPVIYLAWIQLIMGLCATATLPLYTEMYSFMSYLIGGLEKTDAGYTFFNVSSHIISLTIMLPATFMAGMTLPLLTNTLIRLGGKEGYIGKIYAANTFGAIIGIVLAINVFMPFAGVKGVVLIGSVIDVSLGLLLLYFFVPKLFSHKKTLAPVSMIVICVFLFAQTPFEESVLSSGVYRFGNSRLSPESETVFYEDGKTASIALIRSADGNISIRTNGKTDAHIAPLTNPYSADEITMVMAAAVPLMYKPNSKTVANIGMGSGLTTHTFLSANTIDQVDTIEIENQMVKAAVGFGSRVERAFNDPRSVIHIDDAKSFFSSQKNKYDIIVSEPSNPWVSGIGSLFTFEFYKQIQTHLNKNGLFVQWVQLYEININNVASIIKALGTAFKYYHVLNTDNSNILIVASNGAMSELDTWVFDNDNLSKELLRVGIENVNDINIRYIGDKNLLTPLFLTIKSPMNSDYFPYLSYTAPKSRFKNENAADLSWLHFKSIPILYWLNGTQITDSISSHGKYFQYYNYHSQANLVVDNKISEIENEKLKFSAEITQNIESYCDEQNKRQTIAVESLQTVARFVNPYLSDDRLYEYWSNLLKKCNNSKNTSMTGQWIKLHRAISQKNSEKTVEYAAAILNNLEDSQLEQRRYLATAILTSYISEKMHKEASFFMQKYVMEDREYLSQLHVQLLAALLDHTS